MCLLNLEEGGRLDAKRYYAILAKTLDGIWPVGPRQCCAEARHHQLLEASFQQATLAKQNLDRRCDMEDRVFMVDSGNK